MYLHKTISTYGRVIPKPEAEGTSNEEAIDDTPVPIQDQIENLRTKIALKERYNKVISEELEESRQGASSILLDLYTETRELRGKLVDALNAEKAAVQNALRSHRLFQLAMTNRNASVAIPWLQDILFDSCKKFNALLCYLAAKRKKLEEAENMVVMIEKWPRPGTLPWELDAIHEFIRIENKIESVKVKLETATILHSKYYEIKFILREEGGKYLPTLKNLEHQVENHRKELAGLKKMLSDAYKFLEDAKKNQALTEREAIDNRKERRRQMGKMKKAVERLLSENANPVDNRTLSETEVARSDGDYDWIENEQEMVITEDMLKSKTEKIEMFQDRARRLVDAMRVNDLVQIPGRLATVRALGDHLIAELESKEQLKDVLLKQKAQLYLIQCHFRYTGQKQEEEFMNSKLEFEEQIAKLEKDIEEVKEKLGFYGNISVQLRLSVLGIQTLLDEGRRRGIRHIGTDLKMQLRNLQAKFNVLLKKIRDLEGLFTGKETERDYSTLVKPVPVQPRLIRVGSPIVSDDSEEDEILDSKVPNREQIKNKGKRVIQQAILRRGLK